MKRLTDEERIETYFRTCTTEQAIRQRDRVDLILRCREIGVAPAKRGRPSKPKAKPTLLEGKE